MSAVIPAVVLMGPTASGKSAIAMALAARFGGEIVSADSAQVYRGMDIGTAKPNAAARSAVRHHGVDLIDVVDTYSAARFRRDALDAIVDIRGRGRVPIVAGGTMLYLKALRDGLSELPPGDPELRAMLDARAARLGWPALHAELAGIDPATAKRLSPNDSQRIQRALEVHALTGRPLSSLHGRRDVERAIGSAVEIAIAPADRGALHAAIERRFDAMLAGGLVDEVRRLRDDHPLTPEMPSMRCVGYRQVFDVLDGRLDRARLREAGIAATRQLAKRQLTWLRGDSAEVIECFSADVVDRVTQSVARALEAAVSQ